MSTAPVTGGAPGTAATTGTANTVLIQARRVMAAVHSYTYKARSLTTSGKGSSQASEFVGRAVLPDRVSYQATTDRQSFEIVRIGSATYRRAAGQPWQRLASNKNPPTSPTASLLAVLNRLAGVSVATDGTVSGTLSARDADMAGLASGPGVTRPVTVILRLDAVGHVVHFEATVNLATGAGNSILTTRTDFADFDTAPDITAPI